MEVPGFGTDSQMCGDTMQGLDRLPEVQPHFLFFFFLFFYNHKLINLMKKTTNLNEVVSGYKNPEINNKILHRGPQGYCNTLHAENAILFYEAPHNAFSGLYLTNSEEVTVNGSSARVQPRQ